MFALAAIRILRKIGISWYAYAIEFEARHTHTHAVEVRQMPYILSVLFRSIPEIEHKRDAEVVGSICNAIERNLGGRGLTCTMIES